MAPLVLSDFKQHEIIGKGSFGKVYRFTLGDRNFAGKVVPRREVKNDPQAFKNELIAIRTLKHPNIISLQYFFQDNENFYLLTELCRGDLFDMIVNNELTITNAKKFIRELVSVLMYLRDRRFVHRDLKPENILICNGNLKLIDFGFATRLKKDEKIYEQVGTSSYMAPEILKGEGYDYSVDLWALGVTIYVMVYQKYPFEHKIDYKKAELIKSGVYSFPVEILEEKYPLDSVEVKDLIIGLLQVDPSKRLTLEEVANHPFLQD